MRSTFIRKGKLALSIISALLITACDMVVEVDKNFKPGDKLEFGPWELKPAANSLTSVSSITARSERKVKLIRNGEYVTHCWVYGYVPIDADGYPTQGRAPREVKADEKDCKFYLQSLDAGNKITEAEV